LKYKLSIAEICKRENKRFFGENHFKSEFLGKSTEIENSYLQRIKMSFECKNQHSIKLYDCYLFLMNAVHSPLITD